MFLFKRELGRVKQTAEERSARPRRGQELTAVWTEHGSFALSSSSGTGGGSGSFTHGRITHRRPDSSFKASPLRRAMGIFGDSGEI